MGERKIEQVLPETTFEVPEGTHTVTVIVNRSQLGPDATLRIRLAEAPERPAQVQPAGGK